MTFSLPAGEAAPRRPARPPLFALICSLFGVSVFAGAALWLVWVAATIAYSYGLQVIEWATR